MPNSNVNKIISGGQTGVDRAALDAAIKLKIPHGGWCPYQRKAEDGEIPAKYFLIEALAPSSEELSDPDIIYKKRTELNVVDSDGTLIISNDEPIGGTLFTIEMVKKHNKPNYILNFRKPINIEDVAKWVNDNNIHKLNIAGPRESESPNIYKQSHELFLKLFC